MKTAITTMKLAVAACLLLCALACAQQSQLDSVAPWADVEKEAAYKVRFELYTRDNPDDPEVVTAARLPATLRLFDGSRPTKILVHGWHGGVSRRVVRTKNALLARADLNVVTVNWHAMDSLLYPLAVRRVPAVARQLGAFLVFLRDSMGVALAALHIVGHSLGAHIAGLSTLHLDDGDLVGRITGLDPARPLIRLGREHRLHRSQAAFVDVMHTCGNVIGLRAALGHADFYPNGGTAPQPGCTAKDVALGVCSHNRAWELFRDSVVHEASMLARPALPSSRAPRAGGPPDHPDEEPGSSPCDRVDTSAEMVPMGLATPDSARGVFCLSTRATEPYGYGEDA